MNAELDFRAIGSRIQKYRTDRRMTQEELSELIGTSQKYISRIEMGYHNIKLETISSIAKALDISIDSLVYGYDFTSDSAYNIILSEIRDMTPKQLEMLRENISTIKKFK